jgi:putative sigma-54 modulation protein
MSRKTKAAEFLQQEYPIVVTGRNFPVTEPMKNYAIEKIAKIDRFNIRIVDVSVVMDIQKQLQRVEIVVKVDHILVRSEAVSDDMYASIDKAVDRIQTQLRKYHSKIRDHQAKGIRAIEMDVDVYRPLTEEELSMEALANQERQELIERYRPRQIVKREVMPIKTLNHSEAVMKMELGGAPFMIFRSEEDSKLKVIYLREDGNFGIIETSKQV